MFKKAEKKQVKFKVAITGPSGSGKTYSSLCLAQGMGGKVALIDTENGSASLYADKFEFDVVEMSPPYTTEKYIQSIQGAVQAGYDVLIIDSITHAWAGAGGLLEQKEQLDSRSKSNSYTNWGAITKNHEAFKAAILHAPIHIIATMRSKQDYVVENVNGKNVPRKVGMAPVQRDGMEYEFTTVFDAAMDHTVAVSKDRTDLFRGKIFTITSDTGKQIVEWAKNGIEVEARVAPQPKPQHPLVTLLKEKGWSTQQAQEFIFNAYRVKSSSELTPAQVSEFTSMVTSTKVEDALKVAYGIRQQRENQKENELRGK